MEVGRSVVEDLKAQKNAVGTNPARACNDVADCQQVEMEGFRQCNIRDGAALIRYFAWLQERLQLGEQWTEFDAADQLESFRKCVPSSARSDQSLMLIRQMLGFMGLSFDTISSTGANAGECSVDLA